MDAIVKLILAGATPEIIKQMKVMIAEFKADTDETPNPYDDMLADLLQALIGKPDKI